MVVIFPDIPLIPSCIQSLYNGLFKITHKSPTNKSFRCPFCVLICSSGRNLCVFGCGHGCLEGGPKMSYKWSGYYLYKYLEPQGQPFINGWNWWFPTIFYIKIWNHPSETTIYKCLFGVPGRIITSAITPLRLVHAETHGTSNVDPRLRGCYNHRNPH